MRGFVMFAALTAASAGALSAQAEQVHPEVFAQLVRHAQSDSAPATSCLAVQGIDGRLLDPTPTVIEATRRLLAGDGPLEPLEIMPASECGRPAQAPGAAFARNAQEAPEMVDITITRQNYLLDGTFSTVALVNGVPEPGAMCQGALVGSEVQISCEFSTTPYLTVTRPGGGR